MENVQFNEPGGELSQKPLASQKPSFFASLAIKMGLARDEKSAQPVLLIITIVLFVLAFSVLFFGGQRTDPTKTYGEPAASLSFEHYV